jgi:hypothetical protein
MLALSVLVMLRRMMCRLGKRKGREGAELEESYAEEPWNLLP